MEKNSQQIIESWQNIMDVPLTVDVELGRTTLKMEEVLNLQPDSVVTLSRSTGEGVAVLADDQMLVRGEIVVIEDRAGVRVTEIIAKEK